MGTAAPAPNWDSLREGKGLPSSQARLVQDLLWFGGHSVSCSEEMLGSGNANGMYRRTSLLGRSWEQTAGLWHPHCAPRPQARDSSSSLFYPVALAHFSKASSTALLSILDLGLGLRLSALKSTWQVSNASSLSSQTRAPLRIAPLHAGGTRGRQAEFVSRGAPVVVGR